MYIGGLSDLAASLNQARRISDTTDQLTKKSVELTSGLKADLVPASGGDGRRFFALENSLARVETYRQQIVHADAMSSAVQTQLERIEGEASVIGLDMLSAIERQDYASSVTISRSAKSSLESVVSALNSSIGGRYLFAGTESGSLAVADADQIMAGVEAAVSGLTAPADIIAAVDDYFFDPAGGFETSDYLGSSDDLPSLRVSDTEDVDVTLRADDARIRQTLYGLSLLTLGSNAAYASDTTAQSAIFAEGASAALNARNDIIVAREEIGIAQETLTRAQATNQAERDTLELIRAEERGADPYRTATEVEALSQQVELLFTMTVRLSQLTLVNYLR